MSDPTSETPPAVKATVILNRNAGSKSADGFETELGKLFKANGLDAVIRYLTDGVEVQELLEREELPTDAIVVAGGGDGTIRTVAAALAGTGRTLGVLPLGTLNHFAKDLGIPLDLEGAVQTVAQGQVSAVDVGEVNGRVFVNNSGLGIYPRIVLDRETEQRRRGSGKWPAFARASLNAFRRHPFLKLQVSLDGGERLLRTAFVFVGNNEYEFTGLHFGGRACVNAGKLGFYTAHQTGRFGLLRLAIRALFGRLNSAKEFEMFCIEEALIESARRTLLVSTDGEVTRMAPPLHYRIRPGALRVMVPREKGAG